MKQYKITSPELLKIWDKITYAFDHYKPNDPKFATAMESIGYQIVKHKGNHVKLYIPYKGINYLIILATSSSDKNDIHQTLRRIRKIYES